MEWNSRYRKEAGLLDDIMGKDSLKLREPSQCKACGQDFWDAKNPKRSPKQQLVDKYVNQRPPLKRSASDETICTNCSGEKEWLVNNGGRVRRNPNAERVLPDNPVVRYRSVPPMPERKVTTEEIVPTTEEAAPTTTPTRVPKSQNIKSTIKITLPTPEEMKPTESSPSVEEIQIPYQNVDDMLEGF
jgi:hypothetical protein